MNKMENEKHPMLQFFLGGLFALLAIRGCTSIGESIVSKLSKPVQMSQYEINKDGLEDIIFSDGTVQIKQKDGSYVSLKEIENQEYKQAHLKYKQYGEENNKMLSEAHLRYNNRFNEIEKKEESEIKTITDKYTLRSEQVRNSVDNLDYKIKTGRYVIGEVK